MFMFILLTFTISVSLGQKLQSDQYQYGGICSSDQECSGHPFAYCMSNCMCKDYAINAGSTCLEPGSLARGNCGSDQVYVSEAGICMNIAKPGAPCQYSQQCSGAEVGAFCIQMRCRCVYGMTATRDGSCAFVNTNCTSRGMIWIDELGECKPVIAPGARPCSHRQQCTASYKDSVCFMTQCACPPQRPVAVDGTCGSSCPAGQTYSGVLNRCMPTAEQGDRCRYSSQCHAVNPGTVCERGQCRCPKMFVWTGSNCAETCPEGFTENPKTGKCRPGCRDGQIDHDGECLNQVPPDSTCEISAQCTGGSNCVNRICTCPYGNHNVQGVCIRAKSRPGGSCALGEECTDNSYCSNSRCVCMAGMVIYNQKCGTPTIVPPDSVCGPLIECGGGSLCINDICTCPSGYIIINQQCQLPDAVQPGFACTENDRCAGGSFCLQGLCQCPTGTLIIDRRCQIPAEVLPNQKCRPGVDICTGRSLCIDGLCQCPPHLVRDGNSCVPQATVPPGSECGPTRRCGSGSSCKQGICKCPDGMVIINQRCELGNTAPPNYSCRNGEVCTGGSTCQNGICKCSVGQIAIRDVCKSKVASASDRCEVDTDCNKDYICTSGKCTCAGMLLPNGECKASRLAPAGGKCILGVDVCSGGSSCLHNVCKCPTGLYPDNGQCKSRRRVMYTFICTKTGDCIGGASCQNGVCLCPQQTLLINGQCRPVFLLTVNTSTSMGVDTVENKSLWPSMEAINITGVLKEKSLWSSCDSNVDQCAGNAECINDLCQCPSGHIAINSTCRSKSSVPPGNSCSTADFCSEGSTCTNGICICLENYELFENRCRKKQHRAALPGDPCHSQTICTGGSTCKRGTCHCDTGFESKQGTCTKQPVTISHAKPGERCVEGVVRCLGGSVCQMGTCNCPKGTSPKNGHCQPALFIGNTVFPGQPCAANDECSGGSSCIGSICTCPYDRVVVNNECAIAQITVRPGYSCDSNSICMGGSSCISGICRCPAGSNVENNRCANNLASAKPGESCNEYTMICTGGSMCKSGKCTCPAGQEIRRSICTELTQKSAHRSTPGSYCRPDVTVCTGGSYCMNNVCVCPQGHAVSFESCVLKLNPINTNPTTKYTPVPCRFDSQCSGGSVCFAENCVCPVGKSWNANRTLCIVNTSLFKTASNLPGNPCIQNKAPCTGGSYCRNGYCICPLEFSAPAHPCPTGSNQSRCQLPNCFCSRSGLEIPGRLDVEQIPQMVMVTFDDPVNDVTFDIYRNLFDGRYKNPNGCAIKATFFVSHEYNNYQQAEWIYSQGHEIAVNSITHETLNDFSAKDWAQEMDGMRDLLVKLSAMNKSQILGVRAPQLTAGGNQQFGMMKNYGFLYDNSMSSDPGRDGAGYWPQTLDYQLAWPCEAPTCPDQTFPGVWAVPVNQLYGEYMNNVHQYRRGAMVRAVIGRKDTAESAYRLLMNNFNRHYRTNKAPFLLALNADFLRTLPNDGGVKAVKKFLSKALARADVWITTISQAIAWIKHPTQLVELNSFQPWSCKQNEPLISPCEVPNICSYNSTDMEIGDRWLSTCYKCPETYPWIKRER